MPCLIFPGPTPNTSINTRDFRASVSSGPKVPRNVSETDLLDCIGFLRCKKSYGRLDLKGEYNEAQFQLPPPGLHCLN